MFSYMNWAGIFVLVVQSSSHIMAIDVETIFYMPDVLPRKHLLPYKYREAIFLCIMRTLPRISVKKRRVFKQPVHNV